MENITESNKIIAEFLKWKKYEDGTFESPSRFFWEDIHALMSWNSVRHDWKPSDMIFDTDWNWLMEVVEKIESLENNLNNETKEEFRQFQKVLSLPIYSKIEAVYTACVEFIKWYNEQKQSS